MNATIEQLETLHTPLATITPVVWRDGDMCGLAHVQIAHTCPLAWLIANVIARAVA